MGKINIIDSQEEDRMGLFSEIYKYNRFTPEDLPEFEGKLFYEGARRRPYVVRFTVLLFLSTVIASFGVINDSAATVIGAMIIAPLMTPIMATAAAMVMGNMPRVARSLVLVVSGVALVIIVSWIIGEFNPGVISSSQNSQIGSRISPRLTDLAIALASGLAGAFALSRSDVADSLPGVAISISLVPPLCVVGLTLSVRDYAAAWGAMLLFLTNFLSIILAGGAFLAFLGLAATSTEHLTGTARRNAFIIVALAVVLVTIPLAATSNRVISEMIAESQTKEAASTWLEGSVYDLHDVDAHGDEVTILIGGTGEPPSTLDLVSALEEVSGRKLFLTLELVPMQERRLEVVPVDG